MNWKATGLLVAAALVVAIVVYINPFDRAEEAVEPNPPWFYQVSMEDIIHIDVRYDQQQVGFNKIRPGTWVFDDADAVPADDYRWGGIVLLLSGPQTQRDFSTVRATIDDPSEYGLDQPQLVVDVGLTADRTLQFRLGDPTTDGRFQYAQIGGFPQLFIISDTWGKVLERLVTEPPIPKWAIERETADIEEFNIFLGDPSSPDTALLRLKQDKGIWRARSFPDDDEDRLVDPDKWSEFVHLVVGPPDIEIEVPVVDDLDFTAWGISDNSRAIEVRFSEISPRGARFIDGTLYTIGDKTPDGDQYYAVPKSSRTRTPILRVDAEWTDKVFSLFETVPYADPGSAADGATASPG